MPVTLRSVTGGGFGGPPFSGSYNRQEFTASGTFTVPPGARVIYLTGVAAGGGGGGTTANTAGGGGGGGGGRCWRIPFYADSLLIPTVTVTVGLAGTAGAAGGGSGGNGGDLTFGSYVTLQGGRLGVGTSGTEAGGNGGSATYNRGLYSLSNLSAAVAGAAGKAAGNPGAAGDPSVWTTISGSTELGWSFVSSILEMGSLFRGWLAGGPGGGGPGAASTNLGGAGGTSDLTEVPWTDIFSTAFNITTANGGTASTEGAGGGAGLFGNGGNAGTPGGTPAAYGGGGGGGANANTGGGAGGGGYLCVEWWA